MGSVDFMTGDILYFIEAQYKEYMTISLYWQAVGIVIALRGFWHIHIQQKTLENKQSITIHNIYWPFQLKCSSIVPSLLMWAGCMGRAEEIQIVAIVLGQYKVDI